MMDKFLPHVSAHSTQQQQQQQQQQQSQAEQSSKSFSVSEEHRHYLKVFIQTYHNLPILWDTSLRDYTNRDKRADAYQQLVPIYRYLKRDATLEDVKKKINTLRTNYRKELKVVEAARKQGSHYQPRCWTFYELDFLRNAEKFLAIDTSIIKHEHTTTSSSYANTFSDTGHAGHFLDNAPYGYLMSKGSTSPMSITEMFHKSFGHQNNNAGQTARAEGSSNQSTPTAGLPGGIQTNIGSSINTTQYHTSESQANGNKRLKSGNSCTQNPTSPPTEMLNMACDFLSSTYPEEESIARTWTHKLKRLPREQRLLAEKFINDILFEAESGSLHRGSMQLNALEPFVRFEESQNDDSSQEKSPSPNAISTTANSASTTQSVEQTPNESPYHSPIEIKNMLINDGSTPSASNEVDNNRNTSAFNSYN